MFPRLLQGRGGLAAVGFEPRRLLLQRGHPGGRTGGARGKLVFGGARLFQPQFGLPARRAGQRLGLVGGVFGRFGGGAGLALAGFGLGARGAIRRLRISPHLPGGVGRLLGCGEIGAQRRQPVALLQPHRRLGRRTGGDAEPVPAPHRAVPRDQRLSRRERTLGHLGIGAVFAKPDLRQRPRQCRRPLHQRGKGRKTGGRRRRRVQRREFAPMPRLRRIRRRFEVGAQRGPERRLQPGRHGERIEHARPAVALADRQDFLERFRLGRQFRAGAFGRGGGFAGMSQPRVRLGP